MSSRSVPESPKKLRPVRVLVVSSKYPPEYSGSGLRAHRTYQRLKERYGIHFDVLCSSVIENTNKVYHFEGVKVKRIAQKWMAQQSWQRWDAVPLLDKLALRVNYFRETLPAYAFLRRHQRDYDLIHIFGNVAVTSAAVTFCNRYQKPMIVEITYDGRPQPYQPYFMKLLNRKASGFHRQTQFVCISQRLENLCRSSGIHQKIWTRPNPVNTTKFTVDRQRKMPLRAKLTKFGAGDLVILNVAKFMPLKNQSFLLDVLCRLPKPFKLILAGPLIEKGPDHQRDQNYMDEIREKIDKEKLNDRVQLTTGQISEVDQFMKSADVYALPSKIEGLGTPMLESICCGVPVVATHIKGVTDQWIKDGENGYLSLLECDIFAKKIRQAVQIPFERMDEASQNMKQFAGEDVIDARYSKIIRTMTKIRTKE